MREDMFKVIVERPRGGRSWATKSKTRYDKCGERSRVSGHRLVMEARGKTKYLNENLAPLRRYLHKQLGRKWDDVFSEICAHLDTGSTVKMHVREHLEDFVLQNTRRDTDGAVWATVRWGRPVKCIESWTELYVDPDDGLIKETRKLCRQYGVPFKRSRASYNQWRGPKKQRPLKKLSATTWHMRLQGIWYFVELSAEPLNLRGHPFSEAELYNVIDKGIWRDQDQWVVVKKHQLSGKALKAFGLKNIQNDEEVAYYG